MSATSPIEPRPAAPTDSAELIRRIAQADQRALGELYDRTSSTVYSMVLRIVRDRTAAEELTLDLYLHVWHNAAGFDASRGSVRSWLLVMARSRALDWLRVLRRRGVEVGLLESEVDWSTREDPEAAQLVSERQRRVRRALECLPPAERRVIESTFFDGLSHTEAAEALGIPIGTAKSRIRQGLRKLRRSLRNECALDDGLKTTRPTRPRSGGRSSAPAANYCRLALAQG